MQKIHFLLYLVSIHALFRVYIGLFYRRYRPLSSGRGSGKVRNKLYQSSTETYTYTLRFAQIWREIRDCVKLWA